MSGAEQERASTESSPVLGESRTRVRQYAPAAGSGDNLDRRLKSSQDGTVNAPPYRIWPPVALGVPLGAGLVITAAAGDPFSIASPAARWIGAALVVIFVLWNGWTLSMMASNRTAILPGGTTSHVLQSGPFGLSRNPLYIGLITLDLALTLLAASFWALVLVPVGIVAMTWGAIRPEERYLSETFGAEYDEYRSRVRRWF